MKQTYTFRTNINCNGCVKAVTPFLNEADRILSWKVNLEDPGRILTVETDSLGPEAVMEVVREAGFEIQPAEAESRDA